MKINFQKLKESKSTEELLKLSIINIDKPTGPTSFTVDSFIKDSLKLNKTSHFGTLDPQVTGVLPVALGRACRLSDFFMHKDKTYVGIMRLHKEIPEAELKKIIPKFIGKILQLPPVRSRVKREIREREIKTFEILEIKNLPCASATKIFKPRTGTEESTSSSSIQGKDVLFKTQVQAGTYIRKLVSDIGEETGGAHMLELRRTQASIFSETDSSFTNLYDFEKAVDAYKKGDDSLLRSLLIPAEQALEKVLPFLQVSKTANLKAILTGKPLMSSDLQDSLPKEEIFALFNSETLLGIYKQSSEGDILARPLFVLN